MCDAVRSFHVFFLDLHSCWLLVGAHLNSRKLVTSLEGRARCCQPYPKEIVAGYQLTLLGAADARDTMCKMSSQRHSAGIFIINKLGIREGRMSFRCQRQE